MSTVNSDTSKLAAKPLFGIRLRLMLLALLAVVPMTLDRVRVLEATRTERIELASNEMMELARRGAEQQNEMVITVRALVQAAARSYVTASALTGTQCSGLLDGFIKDVPWVTGLSVVGADGVVACSTEPKAVGMDVSDRSYFRRALSGEFVMSDHVVNRATGRSVMMAGFAATTRDGQGVVVIAEMNLEWMGGFANLVSRRPGTVVVLIDANSTVLARYPAAGIHVSRQEKGHPLVAAMLSRREGHIAIEGLDDTRRIYGFVSLPWTNARLAVGLSEAEVLNRVDRNIFLAYAQLAFFGLLALLSAWFAGEKLIVSPIRMLVKRAERFRPRRI